ncbi:hypothetical protein HYZ97_02335 [Candidatus Pacearchaeota archaeon]|nr:hypothetical protein [Candidatus Pacearchaeota archaeon]
MNTRLAADRRLKDGFFLRMVELPDIETVTIDVHRFNHLHLHRPAFKSDLSLTYDGSTYQFGRTFGSSEPRCLAAFPDGSEVEIGTETMEIDNGFFYFFDTPFYFTKPRRIHSFSFTEAQINTIYRLDQESRVARRIEQLLYYIGLSEKETLEVKPFLLERIGLLAHLELGRQQLSLPETLKCILSYELAVHT